MSPDVVQQHPLLPRQVLQMLRLDASAFATTNNDAAAVALLGQQVYWFRLR